MRGGVSYSALRVVYSAPLRADEPSYVDLVDLDEWSNVALRISVYG